MSQIVVGIIILVFFTGKKCFFCVIFFPGELLRLTHILLPPECCNITPALPNLLEYATTNSPQALTAISALQQQHK